MPLHQEKRYIADEYFVLTPQTSERTELNGGAFGAVIKRAAPKGSSFFL